MNSFLRRSTSAILSLLMSVGAIGVVTVVGNVSAASPSGAATVPPWEPDANSVGGLVFYDAAGNVITGGSITDSPIAAYVAGTTVIRSGDTKATLFGYLPVPAVPPVPGTWSGDTLSGPTTYPNNSAPSAIQSLPAGTPVVTGQSNDLTIANLEADFPNNSTTAGYQGVYQLRLKTSVAGKSATTTYDSADIVVTGSTWSVEYSLGAQVTTTTSLSTTPTSSSPFTSTVTLKATVTPSTAVGSVNFVDGTTTIGSAPVVNGTASLDTANLPGGSQALTAEFVPSNTGAYTSSDSPVVNFDVTPVATTTKLNVSPASASYGSSVTITATVSPSSAAGSVAFYDGNTQLTSEVPFSGQAVYSTTALPGGVQQLKAVFTPATAVDYSSSTSATSSYTLKAVATKIALKASKGVVTKGAAVTLTASLSPSRAGGSVSFFDGTKKLASVKVAKGRAVLVTKSLSVAHHVLKAVFAPSTGADYKVATSATVKVTVKQ